MDKAETSKHSKYNMLCVAAGIDLIPVGVDTFGAFGKEGKKFLRALFKRYSKRLVNDDEVSFPDQGECWQRLSVALRKDVAKQLSDASSQMGGAWAPLFSHDSQAPLPHGRASDIPL